MKKVLAFILGGLLCVGCGTGSCMEASDSLLDLSLLRDGEPHYTNRVEYSAWDRGELTELPQDDNMGLDVRSYDISAFDLSSMTEEIKSVSFNTHTIWPDKLPEDFDPAAVMELGKDPGLGIRALHQQGITGNGVNIAIIDQPLVQDHIEYAGRLMTYEEIHTYGLEAEMHGSAVTSIAAGENCGVAPGANIYYIASIFADVGENDYTENLMPMADSIDRILEINEVLPEDQKIKVVSISKGITSAAGGKETLAAIERAKEKGVFVVTTSTEETYGFSLMGLGRGFQNDPNDLASYSPGLFWADFFYENSESFSSQENLLLVPMDARTYAGWEDTTGYEFGASGGLSWSVPWLAGMYALCLEVDPGLSYDAFLAFCFETGDTIEFSHEGQQFSLGTIISPESLMEQVKRAK